MCDGLPFSEEGKVALELIISCLTFFPDVFRKLNIGFGFFFGVSAFALFPPLHTALRFLQTGCQQSAVSTGFEALRAPVSEQLTYAAAGSPSFPFSIVV